MLGCLMCVDVLVGLVYGGLWVLLPGLIQMACVGMWVYCVRKGLGFTEGDKVSCCGSRGCVVVWFAFSGLLRFLCLLKMRCCTVLIVDDGICISGLMFMISRVRFCDNPRTYGIAQTALNEGALGVSSVVWVGVVFCVCVCWLGCVVLWCCFLASFIMSVTILLG